MDDSLKPPSKQPKRYFDIVPSKLAVPSATSRPIVTNQADNLADPMVVAANNSPLPRSAHHKPEPILTRHTAINLSPDVPEKKVMAEPQVKNSEPVDNSDTMMAQEYQEVEHELPSGQTLAAPESSHGFKSTVDSEYMMAREYQDIEHELPSGENINKNELTQSFNLNSPIEKNNQPYVTRPIRPRHHSRRKEFIWVLVAIVVLIIVADLLLDSGVWKPGHNLPHTNFWH